ncbi:putative holin [Pseudomonas sp. NPDC098747]|uniref:putative holin n=1 Tax=Pseudomonas sp. NPDC098747 TaxID=3364487 RepID=UPI00383B50A3
MADPTSSTVTGLLMGLGVATAMPIIDGEALFGAILGAWLVTSTKKDLKVWQRLGSLVLSASVGYLFAPMTVQILPLVTSGGAAFGSALLIIPISIKAMLWIEKADLWDILKRIKGG